MDHKEQWRRDRAAAQTLRSAYPSVEYVRIDLTFSDPEAVPPAAQSHVMHPPARAFFEFPCPYSNCDGKFDLDPFAANLMTKGASRTEGAIECSGMRSRDGVTRTRCGLHVQYAIMADYADEIETSGRAGD